MAENIATGFVHPFLGKADIHEPLELPTNLPYWFSYPDSDGRVPFGDASLASQFIARRKRFTDLSGRAAVASCGFDAENHALYGAQEFATALPNDSNKGVINSAAWRDAIAARFKRDSGAIVTWLGEPPRIDAVRTPDPRGRLGLIWGMVRLSTPLDGLREAPTSATIQFQSKPPSVTREPRT